MSTTDDVKQIARRVPEDVATGRDLDLIEEIFAEDCVEHGPFGREARGPEEIRAAIGSFLEAIPDFEVTVEEIVAEGDTAAMRVTIRGTQEEEFMGIAPTGESFEVQNMVFTRVEDGEIVERWVQPDTYGMLQQLGVLPSLEELRGTATPQ